MNIIEELRISLFIILVMDQEEIFMLELMKVVIALLLDGGIRLISFLKILLEDIIRFLR